MKKKIIIIISSILLISIFTLILLKFEYKHTQSGNNISKSDKNNILDISSYEASITVEVRSNKNTNKYKIKQKYVKPNIFYQEVQEPVYMQGLTIVNDGEKTILENKKLELKKLYENFNGDGSNLNLVSFIEEYKEGTGNEVEETDEEIIMKTKITKSQNKYQTYQNLYINKNTKLPTKMELLDINKNVTVYILYNEIKVNQTKKGDIL